MKRAYVRPTMVGERFVANEYVAACGDKGTVYKFNCDAPAGPLYYYPESDGNINGEYHGVGKASLIGIFYHPCDAKHETSATAEFYDGFVDYDLNGKHSKGEGVIVWRGPYGNNGHATTKRNMKEWETAKS